MWMHRKNRSIPRLKASLVFDVDNRLLDNDRVTDDLQRYDEELKQGNANGAVEDVLEGPDRKSGVHYSPVLCFLLTCGTVGTV
jgi:hypothetical protein